MNGGAFYGRAKSFPVGATFGLKDLFTGNRGQRKPTTDWCAFLSRLKEGDILSVANRIGEMPLPPYIERDYAKESARGPRRPR